MEKKEDPCPCMDGVAKIQTRNTLVSWYNKQNEAVAVMEKEGKVPKEDIENYKVVLKAVENQIRIIDDTPECPEESEHAGDSE